MCVGKWEHGEFDLIRHLTKPQYSAQIAYSLVGGVDGHKGLAGHGVDPLAVDEQLGWTANRHFSCSGERNTISETRSGQHDRHRTR